MGITEDLLRQAVRIARAHGATRLILFGSALTSPEAAHDLDFAVEGVPGWEVFGLVAALEAVLPVPIDVIPLDQVSESHFTRAVRQRGRVLFEDAPHERAHASH
jgi:predicted nucleotidyltransferase